MLHLVGNTGGSDSSIYAVIVGFVVVCVTPQEVEVVLSRVHIPFVALRSSCDTYVCTVCMYSTCTCRICMRHKIGFLDLALRYILPSWDICVCISWHAWHKQLVYNGANNNVNHFSKSPPFSPHPPSRCSTFFSSDYFAGHAVVLSTVSDLAREPLWKFGVALTALELVVAPRTREGLSVLLLFSWSSG